MTSNGHRDSRRSTLVATAGVADASDLPSRPHVVVVGAGIAGLAAATGLAERGITVDVIEREDYLGGRVGGWTEKLSDGTSVAMNRGFHAFFRQYYNLRDLLRRTDPDLSRLTPVDDYPLVDAEGRTDTFRGLPLTPPWNALAFALRSPTFRVSDLVRINARAAAPLAAVSVPDIYRRLDDVDAETFLENINFPSAARHLAFEVFSRSFFSVPSRLSAAELATMFHIYFLGSSEGLVFDVGTTNFDTGFWEPLRRYLTDRRVQFHTRATVSTVDVSGPQSFLVHHDFGAPIEADEDRRRIASARRRGMAHSGRGTAPSTTVLGTAPLARPAGEPRPARVPRNRRAQATGQRQRRGTLRRAGRRLGAHPWRLRRGVARLRGRCCSFRRRDADAVDRAAASPLPRNRIGHDRRRTRPPPRGLPAVRTG